MSKKWSKEDRNSFDNSEVMKEFEKLIISRAEQIGKIHQKIAQDKLGNATQKMEAFTDAATKAGDAMSKLQQNLADDELEVKNIDIELHDGEMAENSSEEDEDVVGMDEDAVGMDVVASSIIDELNFLAKKASDNGDYVSLYEIERTIQEIKDSEGE